MKSKYLKLGLMSIALISPVAVIASCTNNEEVSTLLEPTKPIVQLDVNKLNLSKNIYDAANQINSEWVVINKNKLFIGTTDYLTNYQQILKLDKSLNDQQNQLLLKIKLAAGSFIDATNQPSKAETTFNFTINGFEQQVNPNDDQTKLNQIINDATFKVDNKNKYADDVTTNEIIWDQSAQNLDITFIVNKILTNRKEGKVGFEATFKLNQVTANLTVDPSDSKAISGFKTDQPQPQPPTSPTDQQLVDQEQKRLAALGSNLISTTKLSINQINQYQNNPQSFLDQLTNLNKNDFNYQIIQFSYQQLKESQNVNISIQLRISKNQAHTNLAITKNIIVEANSGIEKPPFPDEQKMRQHEIWRLNQLKSKSFLKQSTFKAEGIDKIKNNPNQLLSNIFGFVPEQYFKYQIAKNDLSIKTTNNNQALIELKISAKLWRANDPTVIVKSDTLSYPITIVEENQEILPPTVTTPYKIELGSHVQQVELQPGWGLTNLLEINLNQDQSFNLGEINFDDSNQLDAMAMAIFKAKKDWFVKITGQLPNDWSWEKYITFSEFVPTTDQASGKITGITYSAQFEYVDSADQSDWFSIDVKLTNGYATDPKPIDYDELWNNHLNNFKNLIQSQVISDQKLHIGNSDVYQFAQLSTEKVSGRHWSNFLNFSSTEFWKETGFLVKPKVINDSINYLTNTINFKWELEGQKELDGKTWTSDLQTINYIPNQDWKDQIPVETSGDLAITDTNVTLVNNILDRFLINPKFTSVQAQKELLAKFGANWTWKAREFVQYLRFTFFQAFNDGADAINIGIKDLPTDSLSANPSGYTIILKARLNADGAGDYLPYLQIFGAAANIQSRQWKQGEIIELRLDVNNVVQTPDAVTSASEILPGLGVGISWAKGKGVQEVYAKQPPRTDIFNIFMGNATMSIKVNNNWYLNPTNAVHRYLGFNLMGRYDFKDQLWQEPTEPGWINEIN